MPTGVDDDTGLETFDPLTTTQHAPFVWDDGVHRVIGTELAHGAIWYKTACNHSFALPVLGLPIKEYRIGNPTVTCRGCLGADQ